jgi:hypothetical protein
MAGHTAAINTCPFPQDIKQLQHFLGMEFLLLLPPRLRLRFAAIN